MRVAIARLLDLIENGAQPECERLKALAAALDAFYCKFLQLSSESMPRLDYPKAHEGKVFYATVKSRWPELVHYAWADPVAGENSVVLFADSADDLADIAAEISEAAWHWDHEGEAAAAWILRLGFCVHWGRHFFDLRSFLHAKLCE